MTTPPVLVLKKSVIEKDDGTEEEKVTKFFVLKNNWFFLSQTEGEDPPPPPPVPGWDKAKALSNLGVTEVGFTHPNGNAQGYARPSRKEIAINPMAIFPWKTTFHEVAHCLLHGEEAKMEDGTKLSRSIQEAEAEAVAFLCCSALGLPGLDESRGYIQGWLGSPRERQLFTKSAARVFRAADTLLKAGCEQSDHPTAQEGAVG